MKSITNINQTIVAAERYAQMLVGFPVRELLYNDRIKEKEKDASHVCGPAVTGSHEMHLSTNISGTIGTEPEVASGVPPTPKTVGHCALAVTIK